MKALKFWKPKESFLILQVAPERINGLLLGLGADKKISARKYFEDTSWAHLASRPDLKHLVKNVIVAADSSLSYTSTIPVALDRENPEEPLSAPELENLLSQAVGRVFNQCRQEAGRHLEMDDLDVVLVGSRVINFKIDGHRVLNPLEFCAHKVEAVLELTLTVRSVLDGVKTILKNKPNFYFTETARAELAALARDHKLPLSLLYLGEQKSICLVLESSPVGQIFSRRPLKWSSLSIAQALTKEWGIDSGVAHRIYHLFLESNISERGSKTVRKSMEPVRMSLMKAIDEAHPRGRVYVSSPLPLFMELPLRRGKVTIEEISVEELMRHFGFSIHEEGWPLSPSQTLRFLAPFWEYYYDRSDSTVNRWLKRHLNWLGAQV
ncbi:MAG TPA: hypothetical protein VJL32_01075 [Candidatus Paceibacterota bacterium]